MPFTQVTVTGTFHDATGGPAQGSVLFRPPRMRNDVILTEEPIVVTLNGSGAISVSLAATDDPGTETPGDGYLVEEQLVNTARRATYHLQVPHTAASIDLADVQP